jgi:hypothetical protein
VAVEELAAEGHRLAAGAARIENDQYATFQDGGVSSPFALSVIPGGPKLSRAHETAVLGWVREHTGRIDLTPTRCSYLYYAPGDHAGLHTDTPYCLFTVLLALDKTDEPFFCFPELGGIASNALLDLARTSAGHPHGGHPVTLTRDRLYVLNGSVVPHHLPRVRQFVRVAAMCYASLGSEDAISARLARRSASH